MITRLALSYWNVIGTPEGHLFILVAPCSARGLLSISIGNKNTSASNLGIGSVCVLLRMQSMLRKFLRKACVASWFGAVRCELLAFQQLFELCSGT